VSEVRPAAVAGSFYPEDPGELAAAVRGYLERVPLPQEETPWPKAVIVPHAGYIYSGPVAASAYARLAPAAGVVERVVLLGPAHYVGFRGLAVPRARRFAGPGFEVAIDEAAAAAIADLPQVVRDDAPHAPEHALEVQLPFLRAVLGEFALLPLVVGRATPEEVAVVLARLWGGRETLVVISSDLSHFHDYATACRLDGTTAAAIEAGEAARLDGEMACGYLGVAGLLVEARRRGLKTERLDLRNSGDTAGPRHSVVGYGAWAYYE
jgi:AmmeMemoRadiSam system protein B